MKNIYIIFCSLLFCLGYGQEKYTFYVELSSHLNAPTFSEQDGKLVYTGKDTNEAAFFAKYTVLEFYQSFPSSRRARTLNVFTVSTYNNDLVAQMLIKFPSKYLFAEDISGANYELANQTYPDDYGSTSPVTNSGVNASFKNLDYINAPKAWYYTAGLSSVVIGISDGRVDVTDEDLQNKTSFINEYSGSDPDLISHGTNVASVAAAQGNNEHGMTGICQNCSILNTRYNNYDNLLALAYHEKPAKIINMSWGSPNIYSSFQQDVINELNDLGVILVAASHNYDSHKLNTDGTPMYPNGLYYYPASYDHVISVLSVNFKNTWGEEVVNDPNFGPISRFVEDMISPSVVENFQGNGPLAFQAHTTNEKVDICAPGYRLFKYYQYITTGIVEYQPGGGTSIAAPHVSGTIGLMASLDECLTSDEADNILKLTSKNLEKIPGNENFAGESGAGKLEAGDAVEFVHNMNQSNGNARIDNQDFYRFDFKLNRINNKLTIDNQIFRDNCTADFTARNIIEVLANSDFKPNDEGFIDLKIDSDLDVTCTSQRPSGLSEKSAKFDEELTKSPTKLYPNPNNGAFEIAVSEQLKGNLNVEVYDIYGKIIYAHVYDNNTFTVNIPNLSSGMYIVRLSYNDISETIKFIKE